MARTSAFFISNRMNRAAKRPELEPRICFVSAGFKVVIWGNHKQTKLPWKTKGQEYILTRESFTISSRMYAFRQHIRHDPGHRRPFRARWSLLKYELFYLFKEFTENRIMPQWSNKSPFYSSNSPLLHLTSLQRRTTMQGCTVIKHWTHMIMNTFNLAHEPACPHWHTHQHTRRLHSHSSGYDLPHPVHIWFTSKPDPHHPL